MAKARVVVDWESRLCWRHVVDEENKSKKDTEKRMKSKGPNAEAKIWMMKKAENANGIMLKLRLQKEIGWQLDLMTSCGKLGLFRIFIFGFEDLAENLICLSEGR